MSRRYASIVLQVASLVVAIVVLTGCETGAGLRPSAVSGTVLDAAQLVVETPLTIPAGRTRLFFQDGGALVGERGVGRGRYDLYRPHCALEIETVDHDGFEVRPGRFEVIRVQRSVVSVVRLDRVRLAALSLAWGLRGGRSDRFHDGYHFWLSSDEQPVVRRMTCYGVYARWPDLSPPTLAEINEALGPAAALGPR